MLKNLGKFDEAIIMYDHALKINQNEYSAYVNKGNFFFLFQEMHSTV